MRLKTLDPIAQQLQRLDDQLAVRPPVIETILITVPAVPAAIGFIAGLSLGESLRLSWTACFIGALLTLLLSLVSRRFKSPHHQAASLTLCLTLLFVWLGMLRLEYFHTPYPNDARLLVRSEPYPAAIRGTIISDIYRENRKSWLFGDYQFTEPARSFYLAIDQYQTQTGTWAAARGVIRVQVAQPAVHIRSLDRVQMYCILSGFKPPANPGQFDFQNYMHSRGVHLSAAVQTSDGISVLERPTGITFRKTVLSLKRLAWQALLSEMPDESDQRTAMATALLLGYQQTIDLPTNEAFLRTGLSHIISLSGMHMAIIAAMVWWIAKAAGLEKHKRAIVTWILITAYALIVPPRAPTLRAVVVCWIFCAAMLFRRRPHPVNTLAVAALVMLLYRPMDLFYPEWQLSYGTILGILLFYKPILSRLSQYTLEKLQPLSAGTLPARTFYWLIQILIEMFAVGIAAWFGGSGILLWNFGSFTPMCTLWTILVAPIVPIILYLGFFKILLAGFLPTLSVMMSALILHCSRLFSVAVQWFAAVDFTSFRIGPVAGWIAAAYYMLILIWLLRHHLHPIAQKLGYTVLTVILVAGLILHLQSRRDGLSLCCLSVGHGQAVVLQIPNGEAFLFDTGSISNKDPGSRVVIPYLKHKGIDRLQAAFISHGDLDHFNGLPEIAATGFIKTVYANTTFLDKAQTPSAPAELTRHLNQYHIPIRPVPKSLNSGPVQIRSLWPTETTTPSLSDNDRSEVLLITYAGKSILLCGDIEIAAQTELLKLHPDLHADIMLLPHHGSTANLAPDFISRIAPDILIASCTQSRMSNAYTPTQNQQAFYTGSDGAIEIKIKADGTCSTVGFGNPK
ncbi:MAG TPA: ComEC/Rec2 family competence protein [Anaerohalosphaeraceae bacterium]|nr:ComEC/Rec2 family competence protein [Anaerohalosphaeraceae bacterium]